MNNILITTKKELRSIFRDKKTLIMLFVLPIMIPVLIVLYGFMFDNMDNSMNEETKIAIDYELSTIEKEILKNNNISIMKTNKVSEFNKLLKKGEIDAYIIYDKDIYNIYSNSTESGSIIVEKIASYLETYNKYKGEQYILKNKLDPNKVYNNIKCLRFYNF